jgi:hypothetical protein
MRDMVYDSLMGFAKKLVEEDRMKNRSCSYLPMQTPAGDNYHERIERIMENTRESQKREE